MKILIAYDGSECADAALEDLRKAGLPETVEAIVMCVADVIVPPTNDADYEAPEYLPEGVRRARERAQETLRRAETMAQQASKQVRKSFPSWQVQHEAVADSPAWALINKAEQWKADLIVMGARGHSVLGGRLILGSVSQRVLYDANCSVRIARSAKEVHPPIQLIVGVDNSENSRAAVEAVSRRAWPSSTEVRLLAVVDTVMLVNSEPSEPGTMKWIEVGDEDNWDQIREIFEPAAKKLRSVGLKAAVTIKRGDPKSGILDEAESWGSHCIFVGAKGVRGIDRLFLGSVSAAVAARAHCSVEVVREIKKSLGAHG